jgi:hypothetical protein
MTIPFKGKVRFKQHAVDTAFATTFNRVQGQTHKHIIMDVNKRPMQGAPLTFSHLYMGLSRVHNGDHFRILPLKPGTSFAHLTELAPKPTLVIWLRGYDAETGMFSVNKACDAAVDKVDDLWQTILANDQLPGNCENGPSGKRPSTTQPTRPPRPPRAQGSSPRVHQAPVRPLAQRTGIPNTGNSCYLNSVLQVFLAHTVTQCDPHTNVVCL